MKVLCYVGRYVGMGHDAGSETTLHDAMKAMVKAGHNVSVLLAASPKNPRQIEIVDGVTVHPYASSEQLLEMARRCDVIVTQHATSDRAILVAQTEKKPVVQFIHNELDWSMGYLAMGCDLAVYNSEHVKRAMEREISPMVKVALDQQGFAYRQRRCWSWGSVILHPPVDPAQYRTESSKLFVTLINLNEDKGARVFYELAQRFPEQKFLGVVGAYGDQIIEEHPNVTILPHTPLIRNIYANTKVLLMPSRRESFGRTAIEAAASGIPTLHSGTEGLVEATGKPGISLDYLDGWELELDNLLHHSGQYLLASRAARRRSEELWRQTTEELRGFVSAMERTVSMYRG